MATDDKICTNTEIAVRKRHGSLNALLGREGRAVVSRLRKTNTSKYEAGFGMPVERVDHRRCPIRSGSTVVIGEREKRRCSIGNADVPSIACAFQARPNPAKSRVGG